VFAASYNHIPPRPVAQRRPLRSAAVVAGSSRQSAPTTRRRMKRIVDAAWWWVGHRGGFVHQPRRVPGVPTTTPASDKEQSHQSSTMALISAHCYPLLKSQLLPIASSASARISVLRRVVRRGTRRLLLFPVRRRTAAAGAPLLQPQQGDHETRAW
jgi:hypothetical protein